MIDFRYDGTWEFELNVFDRSGNLLATKAVADRFINDEPKQVLNKENLQIMAEEIFVIQIR